MEKRVGLWIDRNKAVIVSIDNNVEHRRIITSDMPAEQQPLEKQTAQQVSYVPAATAAQAEQLAWNQLLDNDSLGG